MAQLGGGKERDIGADDHCKDMGYMSAQEDEGEEQVCAKRSGEWGECEDDKEGLMEGRASGSRRDDGTKKRKRYMRRKRSKRNERTKRRHRTGGRGGRGGR